MIKFNQVIKLEGKALEAGLKSAKIRDAADNEIDRLTEEYKKAVWKNADECNQKIREQFAVIAFSYGLDLSEIMDSGEWAVDASYAETHGLAFLRQVKLPTEKQDNVGQVIPEKRLLN